MDIESIKKLKLGNIGFGFIDKNFDAFKKMHSISDESFVDDEKISDYQSFLPITFDTEFSDSINSNANKAEKYFYESQTILNEVYKNISGSNNFLLSSNLYENKIQNSTSEAFMPLSENSEFYPDTPYIFNPNFSVNFSLDNNEKFTPANINYQNDYVSNQFDNSIQENISERDILNNTKNSFAERIIESAKIIESNPVYKINSSNSFDLENLNDEPKFNMGFSDLNSDNSDYSFFNNTDSSSIVYSPVINIYSSNNDELKDELMKILNNHKNNFVKNQTPNIKRGFLDYV